MPKRIIIKINPKTATTEFQVEGVEGVSCTEISNVLTQGQRVEEEGFTSQYYVPEKLPVFSEEQGQ